MEYCGPFVLLLPSDNEDSSGWRSCLDFFFELNQMLNIYLGILIVAITELLIKYMYSFQNGWR